MNEGIKKIKERFEEIEIEYEEIEDCIAIDDFDEKIGMGFRYIIATVETEPQEYIIKIMSNTITKMNNEQEILKLINKFNCNSILVTYTENEDQNIHAKIDTISRLDTIAYDTVTLLLLLRGSISENYKELMKINWSEEVL